MSSAPALTALAVLVGCAHVDEPAGLAGPTIAVTTDSAVHVIGPDFQLDFAATGLRLPEHLTVNHGQVELLGDDACSLEGKIGVAVAPAVAAIAGTGHGEVAARSQITTLLAGPAVAKVRVSYEVDYLCPAAQTLVGTSDFTVFPSGRIVREDFVTTSSTSRLTKVGSCGCQQETQPQNFHDLAVTTFWAFDPVRATQVQRDGSPVTSQRDDVLEACTMYPERAIGVAWGYQAGIGVRYQPHAAASHVLDWTASTDHTALDPAPRAMVSAIQISNQPPAAPSDCAAVLAGLADVPLQIGDAQAALTDHDGIYRDPAIHTGRFTIKPAGFAVPPGFAVSIDLGGASHAVLSRSPAAARVGITQREAGDRFLIVFPEGLAPTETITIEPKRDP